MTIFDEAVILNDGCLMPKLGCNAEIDKALHLGCRLINLHDDQKFDLDKNNITPQIFVQFDLPKDLAADEATNFILNKLKSYHLPYFDLVVMEAKDDDQNIEMWKSLEKLRIQGRIKSLGVKDFYLDDLKNLLEGANVKPAIDKINIVAPELSQFLSDQKIKLQQELVKTENDVINEIAKAKKVSPMQVLLRYNLFENKVILINSIEDFQVNGKDITLTSEERQRIEDSLRG